MDEEQLRQRALESADKLLTWVEGAGKFVVSEAPEVAQQYLAWQFWGSFVAAVLGGAVLLLGVWLWSVGRKLANAKKGSEDGSGFMVIGGFVAFIGSMVMLFSGGEALKVQIAPKVVLLEWLRNGLR